MLKILEYEARCCLLVGEAWPGSIGEESSFGS